MSVREVCNWLDVCQSLCVHKCPPSVITTGALKTGSWQQTVDTASTVEKIVLINGVNNAVDVEVIRRRAMY
jgi:hypothetical protein